MARGSKLLFKYFCCFREERKKLMEKEERERERKRLRMREREKERKRADIFLFLTSSYS